ncbi:MAG: low molecular weight protein-tyrosine-phosphatase [Acidobacteriota bacterium]|nr:low molecular weight protein-tyrosine-phosphatase [Acidobacteriota bacterium]
MRQSAVIMFPNAQNPSSENESPALSLPRPNVLFVCMGNICRSPAAEGVFRSLLAEQGLDDRIGVDSAGTIGAHAGEPADARMRAAARQRGYELTSRARRVLEGDLDAFDLIIAMDRENFHDLQALHPDPRGRLRLFADYLPETAPRDVPDPYYGGTRGFEEVLDLLETGCPAVLEELGKVLDESSRPAP